MSSGGVRAFIPDGFWRSNRGRRARWNEEERRPRLMDGREASETMS